MILSEITITNFKGITGSKSIKIEPFSCIVGQNDAGKSTILKALDIFINEVKPIKADHNANAIDNTISIELKFTLTDSTIILGEQIPTDLIKEELVNQENLLCLKKVWTVGETSIGVPKLSIYRKKYSEPNDFIFITEPQLMKLCKTHGIDTSKGNGLEFNNVEKREKLRETYLAAGVPFTFEYEEIPSTGTSKTKVMGDAIKAKLPAFQYFKADTSLSESDTSIQKYFKDLSYQLIKKEINTEDLEKQIREELGTVLENITSKINDVVKGDEKVESKIEFDWTKLISTSFISSSSGINIPLSSRGDGFRRITMMSYFEYLAETTRDYGSQQIIFGFEEPETFLHPSAQEKLHEKLNSLVKNGFQVLISTHSPVIVGNVTPQSITHISKVGTDYIVQQGEEIDYKIIAIDLGIKPDDIFAYSFSTSKLLFIVEGIDDAKAMEHIAKQYKDNGLIDLTFNELNINIIPIGGCGQIKHWVNLDLFRQLGKPFFIFLDSDKEDVTALSKNIENLIKHGLVLGENFAVTKKRELENYISPRALKRIVPEIELDFTYGDYDDVKKILAGYPDETIKRKIGREKVAEKHFSKLTFDELRETWYNGTEDEFIRLYDLIVSKLSVNLN